MTKILFTALLLTCITATAQTNTFPSSGSAAVGTLTPMYNFQVQKTAGAPALMIGGGYSGSPRLQVYGLDSDANAWMGLGTDMDGGPYEHSIYFTKTSGGNQGRLTIGTYEGAIYTPLMSILENGNVGIATRVPSDKLSVNGNIRARDVKVETANWPDFVFEAGYKLPTLGETEAYIKINGHLPDMPSASQVVQNGLSLGEINVKLLQKIEEMTMHLIEKDKELKTEKLRNDRQQQLISRVISKVAQLEKIRK